MACRSCPAAASACRCATSSPNGTVLDLVPSEDLGFALRPLHSLSDPEPLITAKLLEAGRWIANYYGCSIESVIRALLPEAVRTEDNSAKVRKFAILDAPPPPEVLAKLDKRAPKQSAILALLAHAPEHKMPLADLGDGASASVKSLVKQGLVRLVEEEVRRDPEADGIEEILPDTPLPLNPEQAAALEVMSSSPSSNTPPPTLVPRTPH
jgi:primosomal protein N' (replication factor Y) (superfamily II helicase)